MSQEIPRSGMKITTKQ